jgi:uroporphyrinogen decarboxylase
VDKYQYDGILVDIDTVTLCRCGWECRSIFLQNDAARSHEGNINNLSDVFRLKPVRIGDYKYTGMA